jgi:hypothetical protein
MNEEKLRAEFEALVTAPFWTNNVNHSHVFSVSKTVQGNMYVDTLTEYCWQVYKVANRKLQHEIDTLQGLWATDKPEHIPPELAPYFFRIGFPEEILPSARWGVPEVSMRQASEDQKNKRMRAMVEAVKMAEPKTTARYAVETVKFRLKYVGGEGITEGFETRKEAEQFEALQFGGLNTEIVEYTEWVPIDTMDPRT